VFGREVVRHATADTDMQALLAAQLSIRAVVDCMGLLPKDGRALSLITVDAEDQQRYFLNREGVCSNVRGRQTDDMQFARACRTIMDRCEALDLKAIFMVTGDELDPSFKDAFGDALVGLDDNKRVLQEIGARGHDVGCHGFDHEKWLSKGRSAIAPMSTWQKLRYFFETSGDLRTLFGLARFLVQHRAALRRARGAKRERERSDVEPFTYAEIERDLEAWMNLVGFDARRMFIRYPGYVRAADTLAYLDDRFPAAVDSSDLYEIETTLPAFPYRLIAERNGQLRRTNVTEIPCVWIDKLLRTRDQRKLDGELARLDMLSKFPGSVMSFVTHTKVLGAAWGHCHVYLHDPLRGMALPIVEESWNRFGRFLRERTQSANWRDLQHVLFGTGA
jgi:peptidoglycan/xylan/chitin deacetylase (PgdA/CDA1 family)